MIKLIASDMDGTLLNTEHKLSEENLKAIKEAESKGVKFVIATGRQYSDVVDILGEYNLNCQCILSNGAEYRDEEGNILQSINIDKSKVLDILENINIEGLIAELYTNDGIYTVNSKEEALRGIIERIKSFDKIENDEEAIEKAKSHKHYTNIKHIDDINKFLESDIEIRKIIAFYHDVDVINKIKKSIEDMGGLAALSSFHDNIEVTNIHAQKGYILADVVEKMGIDKEDVIVLGDSFNDYSLFTEFPKSYAMGNAIEQIKEIATYITDTNEFDGVAKAIYKEIR